MPMETESETGREDSISSTFNRLFNATTQARVELANQSGSGTDEGLLSRTVGREPFSVGAGQQTVSL